MTLKNADPSDASNHGDEVTAQVLRDMLEHSEVATLILDPDFRLRWANRAAEIFLGARETHLHQDLREVFADLEGLFAEPDGFLDEVLESYATDSHLEGIELRLRTDAEGRRRWWEYASQPICTGPYTGGRIESFFEITQRRAQQNDFESQVCQARKMEAIGRFAGGIAHDFNNLLTAINGYSQLMERMVPEGQLRTYVEEIRKAGKRANEMTTNLLRISRRQIVHPQVVEVRRLIHDIESLLQQLIGDDIELLTRAAPELGSIQVDPGQMEQVLLNMAINARDAMPTGGSLVIAAKNVDFTRTRHDVPAGSYVCLEVSDTGVGIEPDIVERVFEPMFTTKDKGKGTGFGMATTYATITRADGRILVDSILGKGTTFRIFLPRVDEKPRREPAAQIPLVQPHRGDQVLDES